ncbi:DMT family transporter [Salmonella enterica]|nr:DMT family transporter [Salmonella enterica]EJO1224066.1 DMT family transporter [Salmonella enterica]
MRKVSISILFMLVSLTWGTTWLAMRIAVETIPPVFATGMRFMFAAPFLIIIAWLRKKTLLFPPGQRLFQFVICIFYFSIPFSLMIYGETYVNSGLAAIIFANMPVAVLIASVLFLNEKAKLVFLIFPLIAVSLEDYIYGYAISTHSMLLIIPLAIGIFLTLVARNIPVTSRCRDNSSQK